MSYDPNMIGPVNVGVLSHEDFTRYIIDRDAAMQSTEYIRNMLQRVAMLCEKRAESFPVGYHRHWNNVDAQVLRNLAAAMTREINSGRNYQRAA